MRAMVTGASGFVGGWLIAHLVACGDDVVTLGEGIDILDGEAVRTSLSEARPEIVYHLAALAHVGASWDCPEETFSVNATGTLLVLEAARHLERPPRVVLVSSAEVYGRGAGRGGGAPFDEGFPLLPASPYAASKAAAELVGLQAYLGRDLEVIRVRPFNHVGPGQSDAFVVSALARRIAEAELTGQLEVAVGNLEAARDFTDVRDVVRAYRLVAEQGVPGEVYNVCSGVAVRIRDLADALVSLSSGQIELVRDERLFRPVDVPVLVGDPTRLRTLTSWKAEIPLGQTLSDVLADWRLRLRGDPARPGRP